MPTPASPTPPPPEQYAWLVVSDFRLFEIALNETRARRAAKAIEGYLIKLPISEDFRT